MDDESVYVTVFIQFTYFGKQFFFGHVAFVADEGRFEPTNFAGFYFGGYISFAATVVSHKDSCQVGTFTALSHNFGYFGCNLLFYLFGNGFSVYQSHIFRVFIGDRQK